MAPPIETQGDTCAHGQGIGSFSKTEGAGNNGRRHAILSARTGEGQTGRPVLPDHARSPGRVPRVMRQVGLWVSVALIAAISALAFYNLRDLVRGRDGADENRRAGYTAAAVALGGLTSIAIIVVVFYRAQRDADRRLAAEGEARALAAALEQRVAARTADLARENEERRKVEDLLRAIIDEAPFAVVAVDPARRIVLGSRGAETMFGHAAAEAVGQSFDALLVPPEDAAMRDRVWKGVAGGAPLRGVP